MTSLQLWVVRIAVTWLVGVTREQWQAALDHVEQAAKQFLDGAVKNEWVRAQLMSLFPQLKPYVVNSLLELAVLIQKWLGKA